MSSSTPTELENERLRRWRLLLGAAADPQQTVPLGAGEKGMDDVLNALYDSDRQRGLGSSAPYVNRWLGDIRRYFPQAVVQLLQKDALERLRLHQMLLQPELLSTITPDVHLVGTLLSLKKVIPAQTQETARQVVRQLVQELVQQLRPQLLVALRGKNQAARRRLPKPAAILDWRRTINANLKNYQPAQRALIAERWYGFGRKTPRLKKLYLLVDQSGSMASSMVYAAVIGSILAALPSLRTRFVVFDTQVVDLTPYLSDATDLLFATQLGGGTHIAKALAYAQQQIDDPANSLVVLISDLMEGGSPEQLLARVEALRALGVKMIALLALSDDGTPQYDHELATAFVQLGIPVFACTPQLFPGMFAAVLEGHDLGPWLARQGVALRG